MSDTPVLAEPDLGLPKPAKSSVDIDSVVNRWTSQRNHTQIFAESPITSAELGSLLKEVIATHPKWELVTDLVEAATSQSGGKIVRFTLDCGLKTYTRRDRRQCKVHVFDVVVDA